MTSTNGLFNLRCGITIYPEQDQAIDQLLANLAQRCPAQFILVVDQSGQLVSLHGERGAMDLPGLASLVAADLAASQEIARLAGQYQSFQLVLREGQQSHSFISEAGKHLALYVQVSKDIPLGWARLQILQTARKLSEIITQPAAASAQIDFDLEQSDELTDLFGSALDAVWNDDLPLG